MPDLDLPFIVVHADESCLGNGTTPPNPGGNAALSRNSSLCESFAVSGAIPKIVIVFEIEQVMFQCARAIVRSKLWDPATFRAPGEVTTAGRMLADATAGEEGGAQYDAELPARIQSTLY